MGNIGFGPGPSDNSYDLPGGYWLVKSSTHDIRIIPKEGYDTSNPPPIVPAKVVEIAFDDRYILAKRYKLKPDPKVKNGYEIPDETKEIYYILDTSVPKMYVCSNIDELNEKRKDLKIPATLKLRDVASYNKSSRS